MSQPKVIKRYPNRKLYDTSKSCYITLEDLAKMIRRGDDIVVIDNKTQLDITSSTLTQIIFETEKRTNRVLPIATLRDIIKVSGGSISDFFQKRVSTGREQIALVKGKIQKRIDKVTGLSGVSKEIERLEIKVRQLQKKLKKYEALERR